MEKELTLTEIQEGSYKVLAVLKKVCDEIGVRFFLAYGTLIGAVRHNDIIPWDDDIDVWMPRSDYEKFIKYCRENADNLKPFILKHYTTDKKYIYPIARLCDSRYRLDYTNAKDYGLGLFVDIYPLDGYVENKKYYKKIRNKIRLVYYCGSKKFESYNNFLKNILGRLYFLYSRTVSLNKLLKKLDKLSQKYSFDDEDYFCCNVWEYGQHYKKDDIRSSINMQLKDDVFPIPVGYDNILKIKYGDYMRIPPEEDRLAHHFYKAYKK